MHQHSTVVKLKQISINLITDKMKIPLHFHRFKSTWGDFICLSKYLGNFDNVCDFCVRTSKIKRGELSYSQ